MFEPVLELVIYEPVYSIRLQVGEYVFCILNRQTKQQQARGLCAEVSKCAFIELMVIQIQLARIMESQELEVQDSR